MACASQFRDSNMGANKSMIITKRPWAYTLLLGILLSLTGCGIKKTEAERWQSFCHIYQGAAYNIMFDRQNDVPIAKSIEQINKNPPGLVREMLLTLIKEAHQHPKHTQLAAKKQAAADFQKGKYERCLATAH